MKLFFHKYQGTGNDFIMIDNSDSKYSGLTVNQIRHLCDRRFGIGADGLIKINSTDGFDFEMDYYNADGTKSFCGNGARCSVMFAKEVGLVKGNKASFMAIDGSHEATISDGQVFLKMKDVREVRTISNDIFEMNTGSPHYIKYVEDIDKENVVDFGKSVRYSDTYSTEGINVNLTEQIAPDTIKVYTYERGVEDETLSCGTGVTAAALSFAVKNKLEGLQRIIVQTKGGQLEVRFNKNSSFSDVWLIGPAMEVFEGMCDVV